MKIRCPTCGKLIGLNLETVSILGKMLNKIDYEQEQVVIPSVFYCNECGDNKNLSLVYTINLKDSYFTEPVIKNNETTQIEFGGNNG